MQFNYTLMHKDVPVVDLLLDADGTVISAGKVISADHLPIGTVSKKNHLNLAMFRRWFRGRSIPASRAGFQQLLKTLEQDYGILTSSADLVLKCYALSLSDQYWVQPKNSGLEWKDINFYANSFSDDIGRLLVGQASLAESINLCSPNNTSDGWLPKKWVVMDNERFLMKGAKKPYQQEPFNEVIASMVCDALKIPYTPYKILKRDSNFYSLCPNMTSESTELIPAYYISCILAKRPNELLYHHFLRCCDTLQIPNAKQQIDKMILLDYLMVNTDRHFNNFGALRNSETLEWIGIAPIYDTGTSLWNDCFEDDIIAHLDYPSICFEPSHEKQLLLLDRNAIDMDYSPVSALREQFLDILKAAAFGKGSRPQQLTDALIERVTMLTKKL